MALVNCSHRTNLPQFPRVSAILSESAELPIFDLSERDNREFTAVVCFSSGTSGKPKAVELTHCNLIASLAGIRSTDPTFYHSGIRGVFFAPLCHIYGQ